MAGMVQNGGAEEGSEGGRKEATAWPEVLTCGRVEGATGELYEDDGETADWRGDGTPTIRLRVRNGELAIETGSSGGGAVDRIGIRSVEEGGLL